MSAGINTNAKTADILAFKREGESLLPAISPQVLAVLMKAVSEPLRLNILRVLRYHAFGVLELCHILDIKQSALSHHLKLLSQSGWLATRREGNSIFYRRQLLPEATALQQSVLACVDEHPLDLAVSARLQQVQQERAASSFDFFKQHASRFREQQELIATHALYADGVKELLDHSPLPSSALAIEVGPGSGEFLPVLAQKFKRVKALDNSAEMLAQAQALAKVKRLDNIDFLQADIHSYADGLPVEQQADCAVLNMVLHHTPAPAMIFLDMAKMIKAGGVLLLSELCSHDQSWVSDACGDVWLGFEAEDLQHWAEVAGFESQQTVFHALRNGFQIQLQAFIKKS